MTAAQIAQLLVIATQLVTQIEEIRAQGEANQDAVWADVKGSYGSALAGWNAAIGGNAG